jgi:hypothetical protein
MPGIRSLSAGVQCRGPCAISLQDTAKGSGENVIQMYDNQCYYTKYIYLYITNLIKKFPSNKEGFFIIRIYLSKQKI